jgi:hypothetical protein
MASRVTGEAAMRGQIIHYNASDGKGLIFAGDEQVPFEISLWYSACAPAVNQTVELSWVDKRLKSVTRVSKGTIAREKIGAWIHRLARRARSLVRFGMVSLAAVAVRVTGRNRWRYFIAQLQFL